MDPYLTPGMVRLCLISILKFLGPDEPWLLFDARVKLLLGWNAFSKCC